MPAAHTRYRRAGFIAGLGAGLLLTTVAYILNRSFGQYSLAELLSYRIVALLPLTIFSSLIDSLGTSAKQILLFGVTVGQVVVAGGLGTLWASLAAPLPGEARPPRRWPALWPPTTAGALGYAAILFVVVEVVLLPLFGGGPFGTAILTGPVPAALTTAFEALVYGLALAALYRLQLAPAPAATAADTPPLTRRDLLRRAVLAVAAVAVGGAALGLLNRREAARGATVNNGRVGNGDLPPEVTPTPSFYEVSKNFVDPHVDGASWKLAIGGMVERPYTLTLDAIRAMPPVTDYRTLCCISNEVGGDLISNAGWKGVHLKDLLDQAGVKPGAVKLQLTAADGYTESFPIQKALSPDVLAVYEMNGAPLEQAHGYPLRLLVPNIYGMKNVKWVTKMDVIGTDFQGYWEEQGWSDVATVQTMSRLDFPVDGQLVPAGRNRVGGVAFAGSRGIAKVEVTGDGGKTWQEAQLRRPLGPATWVLWTAELDLAPGAHTLMVRATDGTGALQTKQEAPPPPDGATGWHTITVQASANVKVTPAAGQAAPAPSVAPIRNQGIYSP